MTLCEENIMFSEVPGIGTEFIGLLWNLPFLEYSNGLLFLGLFICFIVPPWSLLLSVSCLSDSVLFPVSCFLTLVFCLLFLSLVSDCCFCF